MKYNYIYMTICRPRRNKTRSVKEYDQVGEIVHPLSSPTFPLVVCMSVCVM